MKSLSNLILFDFVKKIKFDKDGEFILKKCLEKDCIDGCMTHELRDTFSNRSDDIEMSKNP